VADPIEPATADIPTIEVLTKATGSRDCAVAAFRALESMGWGPAVVPPEGQVRFRFDVPATAAPSLRCLWVMVQAWEVSTEGLNAREKDRCIAYLVSLLQAERRSHEVTVHPGNVRPGP